MESESLASFVASRIKVEVPSNILDIHLQAFTTPANVAKANEFVHAIENQINCKNKSKNIVPVNALGNGSAKQTAALALNGWILARV